MMSVYRTVDRPARVDPSRKVDCEGAHVDLQGGFLPRQSYGRDIQRAIVILLNTSLRCIRCD